MQLKKIFILLPLFCATLIGCNRPSRVEQYRAEKKTQDSIRLAEQVRSLDFYQRQLDSIMPIADSLIALFKYERNEKYQDHGYYTISGGNGLRILVRDDAEDFPVYRHGKRLTEQQVANLNGNERAMLTQAQELEIAIRDIQELEKRIRKTSIEVQKYQKRMQKQ